MHKTVPEAIALAVALKRELYNVTGVDIVIYPSHPLLGPVGEIVQGSCIAMGGQDMHWEPDGAYTGEVSAAMLKSTGCRYVIIGHSERRQYFGETNETVNRKLRAAMGADLTPIVCIGESLSKREQGVTDEVLRKQLEGCYAGMGNDVISKSIIAYEPVWAIGTGRTATPRQAADAHSTIRRWVTDHYNRAIGDAIRILYGGSVNPGNAGELLAEEGIDGALVGGASLKADSFSEIVTAAA